MPTESDSHPAAYFLVDPAINRSAVQVFVDKLKYDRSLPPQNFIELLERSHALLDGDANDYGLALQAICYAADTMTADSDALTRQLLYDCIVKSRIFLYTDTLEKLKGANVLDGIYRSPLDFFSRSYYAIDDDSVLTKDQMSVFELFQQYRRLVVSAPTSFGKTKIIEDIIICNTYKCVVIVQPTRALLNETYVRFRLKQSEEGTLSEYDLIVSVASPKMPTRKAIYFLTPEKVDLLMDTLGDLKFDFFVMDEVYKITEDDDRSQVFTHCLYRLSKQDADFYIIGPYYSAFSPAFLGRTGSTFRKFTTEIVQKDTVDIASIPPGGSYSIGGALLEKYKTENVNLVRLLHAINRQPTLVYVGRKDSAESRAKLIAKGRDSKKANELADYIEQTIAKDWSLSRCIRCGVAFHHGAIPRYIQHEIVDQFNCGAIDVVFCTPTLTEGVNTSAKNVIVFHGYIGRSKSPLSGFDVKNIKGRAGRFREHFVGNVYLLANVKDEQDYDMIDFPYYDNEHLPDEEVLQVDASDLSTGNVDRRRMVESELADQRIPLAVVRANKFMSIGRQTALVKHLRSAPDLLDSLRFPGPLPARAQCKSLIALCHEYLFGERDREDRMFRGTDIAQFAATYALDSPSLQEIISGMGGPKSEIDTKVRQAFHLVTHFFEFSLPRSLAAFARLYNFVCSERFGVDECMNIKPLITKLQYGYLDSHEIALKEAGVPPDIIRKVSKGLTECDDLAAIRARIATNPELLDALGSFERRVFNRYV